MFYRKILLGAAMAAALTSPALAEAPANAGTPINSAVVHSMDGRTTIVQISAERQAELIASPHAKQLAAGIVVLVANGKTYVIDDHKMPSGEPMVKTILNQFAQEGGG
jgi:hypothetical protein